MGDGECAGEVMRGLLLGGVDRDAFGALCGTICAIAGEPPGFIEPNVMFGFIRLLGPPAPPFG